MVEFDCLLLCVDVQFSRSVGVFLCSRIPAFAAALVEEELYVATCCGMFAAAAAVTAVGATSACRGAGAIAPHHQQRQR